MSKSKPRGSRAVPSEEIVRQAALVADPLLRLPAVRAATGLGTTSIYTRMQRGEFPKPVKIGYASRWPKSKVEAWIASVSGG
jgi:prophage regulatory protein